MLRRHFLFSVLSLFAVAPAFAKQKVKSAGGGATIRQTDTLAELTESECTKLGGTVTTDGAPALPSCSTGKRCKTTTSSGDIHSVCIDEAN